MRIQREQRFPTRAARLAIICAGVLVAIQTPCYAGRTEAPSNPETGVQVTLRTPPRERPPRPDPVTPLATPEGTTLPDDVLTGLPESRDGKIDIFSKSAVERVALGYEEPDDAPPVAENEIDFSCDVVQGRLSVEVQEKLRHLYELGVLQESACREIGERDPEEDLTTSEKLARKYPPIEIGILGGWVTVIYEPYPTGPVALDHLAYPIRGNGL